MKIKGDWNAGLILDWHVAKSEYLGHNQYGHPEYDTKRTAVGEALYLLKYRSDLKQIDTLAKTMTDAITQTFPTVEFVVPMPPSKQRATQPLTILAKKVAELLNIPIFENILLKDGNTPQMKDIKTKEEKIKALMGCFHINDAIENDGQWDVLIIDDLYSSGASLTAATQTMKTYGKVKNIYVAAFTRTRS
ncbi:MAG: ComF family protein [Candidatus Brocadiales bacterium]|nr:ComF family protein [Candidatus Brocadiales bacterium]